MSQPKKQYSRELIERYRAQNFEREVVERIPVDLEFDEASLSCGHKRLTMPGVVEPTQNLKLHCVKCAEEWLAKEGNGSEQR